MRTDSYSLNIPASPGPGTPLPVKDLRCVSVQLEGTWTGNLLIEGSISGGQYETIGTALTAHSIIHFPTDSTYQWVRVNTTSVTGPSGLAATLAARNARTV
jgi:hypothetical protein